jgi:hypothetical protein
MQNYILTALFRDILCPSKSSKHMGIDVGNTEDVSVPSYLSPHVALFPKNVWFLLFSADICILKLTCPLDPQAVFPELL